MTIRCIAWLAAWFFALLFSACVADAAPFRFYVRVDGVQQYAPPQSRPPVEVATDVVPFPVGKQVQAANIPAHAMGTFLLAVRTVLALPVGAELEIRWAQRVGDGASTTSTTVPGVTTTSVPGSTTSTTVRTTTTTPRPSTTTTTLPLGTVCRLPGADISVRIDRQNFELLFNRSSPGVRFASNQERDCMEDARIFALKQAVITAGDLAPTATGKALDCLTLFYTRIGVICPYQGCTHKPQGAVWNHNTPGGRDYQCSGATLQVFQDELTAPRTRDAATARLASAVDLRNVLDVNATLDGPAPFAHCGEPGAPPCPKADTTKRGQAFMVDTRDHFPPCGGGNGCVDLDATVHAHHCAMLRKIKAPVPSDCEGVPSPSVAHVKYEAGCGGDENCQWFRRLTPFSGFEDRSTWNDPQLVQLAKLTHVMHGPCWAVAQRAGNAPRSKQCDRQHDIVHTMENIGRGWFIVWPADGVAPDEYLAHQGNKRLTPEELLPRLVALYGIE